MAIALCTLFFTFAAAGMTDMRSHCEMGVVTDCQFEQGTGQGIYGLPYVDQSVKRLTFDRLPTKVDRRNLPQVDELKITIEESERGACSYIMNNEQPVAVVLQSKEPVVCVSIFYFYDNGKKQQQKRNNQ